MPIAKLELPEHPRTKVFRRIISFLQANEILRRTVKPGSWLVWDGNPANAQPLASGLMPAIRMTPIGRQVTPITPVRQVSPYGIQVEIAVNSFHMDDLQNLWGAFELAIFPGDGSNAVLSAMQSAKVYPEVYDINLEQPAISPQVDAANAEYLLAVGVLTVQMLIKK